MTITTPPYTCLLIKIFEQSIFHAESCRVIIADKRRLNVREERKRESELLLKRLVDV